MYQVQRWTDEWETLWEGEDERESRQQFDYYTKFGIKEAGVFQQPQKGIYRRMSDGERLNYCHVFV